MAIAGAIVGAGTGGFLNDRIGRKPTMIIADILFFIGAIVQALAVAPWMIIIGRVIVGLGVGMASMTSPLYISETSPTKIRGALVSTNGLLITGGQFISYLINLGFTRVRTVNIVYLYSSTYDFLCLPDFDLTYLNLYFMK